MTEQDWTQRDPTREQIVEWMKARKQERPVITSDELAQEAYEHFARPIHINALRRLAVNLM